MLYDQKKPNLITLTDCYNLSHQSLKHDTRFELSHIYNRTKEMLLFGFSDNINYFFKDPITWDDLDEAYKLGIEVGIRLPYNLFARVIEEFNGYPPLCIVTVPEGMLVPPGTPFAQIWNTAEGFGELVTWWEPLLLWSYFPSGCATRSLEIHNYNEATTPSFPRFHSFGFRAMGNHHRAIQAGCAWSLFNPSSDDFHISRYLPGRVKTIPASAHKVVQQWDDELSCCKRAIDQVKHISTNNAFKAVSIPIDTFSSDNFIKNILPDLIGYASEHGVYLVARPDSGDVLAYGSEILDLMKGKSGGIIIGDGVTYESAKEGDNYFRSMGHDLHKIVWGIGAGFYNDINRDSYGLAMKTAISNFADRMKFSDTPIKQSIPGRVKLTFEKDKVIVDEAKEVYPEEGYTGCYYHTHELKHPSIHIPSLEGIRCRALVQTPGKQLVLSETLQEKINKLRTKYISSNNNNDGEQLQQQQQ